MSMKLALNTIEVRERTRTDLRNLDSLAASIRDHTLIQPPVVRKDGDAWVLIAGQRRIAAMQSLGWSETPVVVAESIGDELAALYAEGEENSEREPFTPTEAVAHRKRIAAKEAADANRRQSEAGKNHGKGIASGNLPEAIESEHERRTRTRTAKATGYGGRTLDKAESIVDAAADPTAPEPVRTAATVALKAMDETGKVDGAHKEFQRAKTEAERVTEAVTEFGDLAYYAETGQTAKVLRLAQALRGYQEPELSGRLENLRKTIAVERREPRIEPEPAGPDYHQLADNIFTAANTASRLITKAGGPETLHHAIPTAHRVELENWRGQFLELAQTCQALADACKPQMRIVK